jgi:hypothetical protein
MKARGYGIALAGCVVASVLSSDDAQRVGLFFWALICFIGLLCTKGQQ